MTPTERRIEKLETAADAGASAPRPIVRVAIAGPNDKMPDDMPDGAMVIVRQVVGRHANHRPDDPDCTCMLCCGTLAGTIN